MSEEVMCEMTEREALALIDLLERVKNALHAYAIGVAPLTPERADELRHEIERALRPSSYS